MTTEPTTDLVTVDPSATTTFLPSEHVAGRVWALAHRIAGTEFVPGTLRGKPEAILAAMLTGREIGIGAMHSLRAIDVIDGRPSLSPELLHALALREGHDLDVEDATRAGCTVAIRRHDWPADRVRRVTFDEVDARLAGLVGKDCKPADGVHVENRQTRSGNSTCACKQGYRTYPRAMYRSRAIAEACRTYLPDVVERIGYTAEEFGGTNPDHADAVETVRDALGDEAADRAAEQLADDDEGDVIVDAEILDDDDEGDEGDEGDDGTGRTPAPDPDPDPSGGTPCAHDGPHDPIDTRGTVRCRRCGHTSTPDDAEALETVDVIVEAPTDAAEATAAAIGGAVAPPEFEAALLASALDESTAARADTIVEPARETAPTFGPSLDEYRDWTVSQVAARIRDGALDPAEAWALEVEAHDPPRKTVRGLVGDAATTAQETRSTPSEGGDTGGHPSGAHTATQEPAEFTPDGMDDREREYRRTVLKRYRTVYREVYHASQDAAGRLHALRLETIGNGDGGALWVDRSEIERLEQGIAEIRAATLG